MISISQKTDKDICILTPYGRIDHATSDDFEKFLDSTIQDNSRKIIIDFSNCNYVSSSGLRVLLVTSKTLQKDAGSLVLCNLPPHIEDIFETAGFTKIFNITDSVETALTATRSELIHQNPEKKTEEK